MYIHNHEVSRYILPHASVDEKTLKRLAYSREEGDTPYHPYYGGRVVDLPGFALLFLIASSALGNVALNSNHLGWVAVCFSVAIASMIHIVGFVVVATRPRQQRKAEQSVLNRSVSVRTSWWDDGCAWDVLMHTDYGNKLQKMLDKSSITSKKDLKRYLEGEVKEDELFAKIKPVLDSYLTTTAPLDDMYARNVDKASKEKLEVLRAKIEDYARQAADVMKDIDKAHQEQVNFEIAQAARIADYEIEQTMQVADLEIQMVADLELPPVSGLTSS